MKQISWRVGTTVKRNLLICFDLKTFSQVLTFSQFIAEKISVWSGVIERKTWNPLSCKMNNFSSNCSILTSSATGTDMHHQGSQTTYTTESRFFLRCLSGTKSMNLYIRIHENLDELIILKNSEQRKTSRGIPSKYTLGLFKH